MWMRQGGNAALLLVGAAWVALLAAILAHRVFVTNDSLSNYIHVWYIAQRFWGGHGVPFHMPLIGHGQAFAFPYGFIPWMSAALLRPLLGDRVVTLWLVAGALGVIGGAWWAFPELRGGWWTALLLLNPMLIEGPLLGQLPFLWATAMLFAAIALWRGERRLLAALALGAAQATHAPVLLPIAGVLVVARLWWEPRRGDLLAWYAVSLLIAAPAAWIALVSPTVEDASARTLMGNFFGTVSLRAIVVGAPFIGLALQRTAFARVPVALFAALIALNVVLVPVRRDQFAWGALRRTPDHSLTSFIDTASFVPGATYRILRVADGKVGMYDLLRAGARLDSEPFPESIDRRSWPTLTAYLAFLRGRQVDYVIVYNTYDHDLGTNEHHLLEEMAGSADAQPCTTVQFRGAGFDVYRIHRERC
ncbi:MAG TPA: hypothetical protein VEZ14_12600 [Dehalococcoidia bacterium]|nr:hypothetical protein [Dehalococcoidia bacterium]